MTAVRLKSGSNQECQQTEQAVLKRMAAADEAQKNPFVVKLWWSFHDSDNLYLVLSFHPYVAPFQAVVPFTDTILVAETSPLN